MFHSKSRDLCSNRIPEAALMARSYLPSKVSEIVALWRKDLNKVMTYVICGSSFLDSGLLMDISSSLNRRN